MAFYGNDPLSIGAGYTVSHEFWDSFGVVAAFGATMPSYPNDMFRIAMQQQVPLHHTALDAL